MAEETFFKWIIKKWHFWMLSVAWAIWSASEDISSGYFISAITIIIIWTILIGLIYFIIFKIIKGIEKSVLNKIKRNSALLR